VPPDRQYDLIFFNPPYVPTLLGEQLKMTRRMRADSDRVWNGGQDGTDVLRQFLLQAPAHLSPRGRVVFGVQPIFVPDQRIDALVKQTQLAVLHRITRCCIPSTVYVLYDRARLLPHSWPANAPSHPAN
jgi:methylase of polypeptide subunit release factors